MTSLLEKAIDEVRRLTSGDQDQIARAMLALAGLGGVEEVPSDHLPDVLEGLKEAERGDYADDGDVEAALAKFSR